MIVDGDLVLQNGAFQILFVQRPAGTQGNRAFRQGSEFGAQHVDVDGLVQHVDDVEPQGLAEPRGGIDDALIDATHEDDGFFGVLIRQVAQ